MASLLGLILHKCNYSENPSSTKVKKQFYAEIKKKVYKMDFARNPAFVSAKGSSLSAFFQRKLQAGMTVEASVILPLCVCFLLNLASAIEMIRLHNNLQFAVWSTGSRIAALACEEEYPLPSLLTQFYVRCRIVDNLGEEYLDQSPLTYGSSGLWLLESDLAADTDELDFVITYQVSPFVSLAAFRPFRMANRCCVRLWNGYEIPVEEETNVVYVTEHGQVFHRDRNCTHLRLSIREINKESLDSARNRWGRRYAPCEKCAGGVMPTILYLTDEGDCYHYARECSGLKRTLHSISEDAAAAYRPCSRCGR